MSLLQRQICLQNLSTARLIFPVPLIRMVYEANPAAISHQEHGCLYINAF
jgi:hypothetical protein